MLRLICLCETEKGCDDLHIKLKRPVVMFIFENVCYGFPFRLRGKKIDFMVSKCGRFALHNQSETIFCWETSLLMLNWLGLNGSIDWGDLQCNFFIQCSEVKQNRARLCRSCVKSSSLVLYMQLPNSPARQSMGRLGWKKIKPNNFCLESSPKVSVMLIKNWSVILLYPAIEEKSNHFWLKSWFIPFSVQSKRHVHFLCCLHFFVSQYLIWVVFICTLPSSLMQASLMRATWLGEQIQDEVIPFNPIPDITHVPLSSQINIHKDRSSVLSDTKWKIFQFYHFQWLPFCHFLWVSDGKPSKRQSTRLW